MNFRILSNNYCNNVMRKYWNHGFIFGSFFYKGVFNSILSKTLLTTFKRNRSKLFFKSHFWQLGNLLALFVLICELRNKIMFLFFYLGSRQFPFFSAQYIKSYIYRQNIRFSNINFVAKSSGFLSRPQKYDETYQSIKVY